MCKYSVYSCAKHHVCLRHKLSARPCVAVSIRRTHANLIPPMGMPTDSDPYCSRLPCIPTLSCPSRAPSELSVLCSCVLCVNVVYTLFTILATVHAYLCASPAAPNNVAGVEVAQALLLVVCIVTSCVGRSFAIAKQQNSASAAVQHGTCAACTCVTPYDSVLHDARVTRAQRTCCSYCVRVCCRWCAI
jgi:hypothetical protein